MNVCTIIAKNYLAHARVLARSLAETNPGSCLWTLVIDDFSRHIDPAQEPFHILTPAEVGCDRFTHMALRYSVLELSTAVKPWLLRHLMRETGTPVTYLDPDIKVYGSLDSLDDLAARHGVVLIPHNSKPVPQDGRKPSQVDIMIAGIYNLGYVSLAQRPEVDQLLDWWADRLLRDCRVDPIWGYFVDQRWFDLVPGFLSDLAIVRDPEYNLAYWNLHERRLEYDAGRYRVDGRQLAFFHFSGLDPDHPLVLSRHQDRIDVVADPVLERLLAEYAAALLDAGHTISRSWPYGYGALGDGTRLDNTLRTLYDDYADEANEDVLSPFTLEGARAFQRWLKQQAPSAPPGINRVLHHVYEHRSDIRAAYTGAGGVDRLGLLRWAEEHGRREEPLLARFMTNGHDQAQGPSDPVAPPAHVHGAGLDPAEQAVSSAANGGVPGPLHRDPWGVNVVGYFRSELGTGEAARQVVGALDAKGIPVLPVHGQTVPLSRQGRPYETASPADAPFPINLICMNADMLPEFASQVGEEFFAQRYSIGLWFWEVSRFPDRWRESFSLVEEVWAPTSHIAAGLESVATVPVNTVRIPVHPDSVEPRSRGELDLPEGKFLFLFSFDYLSVVKRKNPLAVIEAFRRACAPGEGAGLLLKCINHERDPDSHAELRAAAATHPDINVIDRYMSPVDNTNLTALCDCYVSLHRAEGFGLGMAEAMFHGKPVIATGYSGNLDFMTRSNSLLVDHRLVPIGPGADPYPAGGLWADPDIEHASTLMRQVLDDRDGARRLGTRAAADIRSTHSPASAGEIMHRRLESIRGTGRVRRAGYRPRERQPALAALPMRIRQGPAPASRQGGAAREFARKATLRAMRPFTVYQQTVNAQVATAMEELSDGLREVRREAAGELARLLGELRGAGELRSLPSLVEEHGRRIEQLERSLDGREGVVDRAHYLALAELQRRHAAVTAEAGAPPPALPLRGYELRGFSRHGEDGVLAEIFRRTGAPTRYFVEVGAGSAREGNCVYLADVAGWRGVFLEAAEEFYRLLERKYQGHGRVRTTHARVAAENVERLLAEAGVPPEPDLLSIDIDHTGDRVWGAIERHRPRVVAVAYTDALVALAKRKGYRLVHIEVVGIRGVFVREELAGDAFPEPEDAR